MKKRLFLLTILTGVVWIIAVVNFRPPLLEGISFSQAVYDKNNNLLRLTLSADEKYRLPLPLSDISPLLIRATLLQEDQYFRWHTGINPIALVKAVWRTYVINGRRIGASTITMQLARIRFGVDSRTLSGKLLQMAIAFKLELLYSKDEILEAYLNLIPYGRNIEGIGAASLIYFKKEAAQLTLPESLTLIVIPQNPSQRISNNDSEYKALLAARKVLFHKWVETHPHDKEKEPDFAMNFILYSPSHLPFLAPHFVDSILETNSKYRIVSTLDISLQNLLERHARNYIELKKNIGVKNASVLLLDYNSMEVKAALGSIDFFNNEIHGQVNGTRAKRSPGSTIKPFIYALGIDQGVIHPMTMLKDAPSSFGDYNPENFDRDFTGPVKVAEALIRSRNIPAVQVATQLTNPNLYQFLKSAAVSQLKEESFYGLALVLGGAEMTMEELVKLYAMLANGGILKPLRTQKNQPEREAGRLLSKEASFLTLDILKGNPRPAQGYREDWVVHPLPVYWKTGTSYAYRDAWAIGIFGPYVLAVWVGNFDGEGNPAFIGVEAAAPLLFQLIDAMRSQDHHLEQFQALPMWDMQNLEKVDVCALSGQIPGPHCKHTISTWFIPGKSPIRTCEIHREVVIDKRTGMQACGNSSANTRREIFEFWPSDLLKIFRQAGIPRRIPPPVDPLCSMEAKVGKGTPPQITSPQRNITYNLRASAIGAETIPLVAVTDANVREVYWFINEKFLGKSKTHSPFFWPPQPGKFVVRIVDDQGRSDVREIKVSMVE